MMIACPACRAQNSDRTCRRCRADLGLLWDLERQRARSLALAIEALARRDAESALANASSAMDMRAGPDASRIIACAHLLARRFDEARRWHALASS